MGEQQGPAAAEGGEVAQQRIEPAVVRDDLDRYKKGALPFPSYIVDGNSVYIIRPNESLTEPFYAVEKPLPRNPINKCPPTAP